MNILSCINIASACDLNTIEETYSNIIRHSPQIFNWGDIVKEETELINDYKKYGFVEGNHIKDISLNEALNIISRYDNEKTNMKLFSFCPQGHGQLSFYIMAESEESATTQVKEYIKNNNLDEYDYYGFGTDYYQVTATEPDVVITNRND